MKSGIPTSKAKKTMARAKPMTPCTARIDTTHLTRYTV